MNRFIRFAALRWMYNVIVPPRYRDKLNITEELCAFERALNKVIEVTNANGKALEAISQDLEDIQFGAGGYYRPAITENEDGSVTFSFVASDDSMPPIEEKTFFLGDMQTITKMLQGFNGDPMEVKNYIDEMSGGYYTPVFEQEGNTVKVSFRASNKMLPALDGYSFTLPAGPSGKSAYEIAVDNGFEGSVEDFFASLKGGDGKSAYDIAVDNGFKGSVEDFFASLRGDVGKSAYQYAQEGGYTGTEAEFAARLAFIAKGASVGYINNGDLVFSNLPADGEYTAYFEVDGELVKIGLLTVGADEPDPVTYTVTFKADGVTVATVTYEAGATAITEPTVPAKDGYTGAWESYTLNDTNITVNAVYTAIEVEPAEPKNFAGTLTTGRLSNSGTGYISTDTPMHRVTDYVPVQNGDTVYIAGFLHINDRTSGVRFLALDGSMTSLESVTMTHSFSSAHATLDSNTAAGAEFTIISAQVAYVRFSDTPSPSEDAITVNIKRDGKWVT